MPELLGALEITPNSFTGSDSVSFCLREMPVAVPPSYFQGHMKGALRLNTQMREAQRKWVQAAWEGIFLVFTKWLAGILLGDWKGHLVKLSCSSSSKQCV